MKTIVGIFAHPDDEAFGPGGTLAKLAKENEVYLICVTNGDAVVNGEQDEKLGEIRKKELEASAKTLGIKKVFFLGFHDGTLNNNMYHAAADKIKEKLEELRPEIVITLELRGISGHLDHIAVSMITTYVVQKLSFVKELWYFCTDQTFDPFLGKYFIYFPPGYKKSQIDKVVDVSDVWVKKIEAMHQHKSQIQDVQMVEKALMKIPKEEYFLIKKK